MYVLHPVSNNILPDVLRMVQKNNVVRTDLVVCRYLHKSRPGVEREGWDLLDEACGTQPIKDCAESRAESG